MILKPLVVYMIFLWFQPLLSYYDIYAGGHQESPYMSWYKSGGYESEDNIIKKWGLKTNITQHIL